MENCISIQGSLLRDYKGNEESETEETEWKISNTADNNGFGVNRSLIFLGSIE